MRIFSTPEITDRLAVEGENLVVHWFSKRDVGLASGREVKVLRRWQHVQRYRGLKKLLKRWRKWIPMRRPVVKRVFILDKATVILHRRGVRPVSATFEAFRHKGTYCEAVRINGKIYDIEEFGNESYIEVAELADRAAYAR